MQYDEAVKRRIFEFQLLPGDRFTESEVAEQTGVSRTPVRQALYRLEREGYIFVSFRNGWSVQPFDFEKFENLYDVRVILEIAAVRKICESPEMPDLSELKETWLIPAEQRLDDFLQVSQLDEHFHEAIVAAAGNAEMAKIHHDVTERIRIIRRLDFTQPARVATTYQEHAKILRHILQRRADQAILLLKSHIETSKAEVRKITLHKLFAARATPDAKSA